MNFGNVVPIAGFPVHEATPQDLSANLLAALRRHEKISLLFANSNFIIKCKALLKQMCNERVVIVNDGIGLDIAARVIHGRRFKANLNGTDFTPYLLRRSARPLRVFLLGARPGIVRRAAGYAAQQLGQQVVGWRDGYNGMRNNDVVIEHINRSRADVLLVALGNPAQEEWILRNREALDVDMVAGVGALFDFWAGGKLRAPRLVRRLRMEWLFRLCQEPHRLLRRYTVDTLMFFAYCFFQYPRNPQRDGSDERRPAAAEQGSETRK